MLSKALSLANSAKQARISDNAVLSAELSNQALELVGLTDETRYVETIESLVFDSSDCFFELETLLDIHVTALSQDNPLVGKTLDRLILRWQSWLSDYYVLLAPVYDRLIVLRISQIGAEHPEIADLLMSYGEYLTDRGANSEALNCFMQAASIRKANLGTSQSLSLSYAQAVTRLGCLLLTMNKYEVAEVHLKTAIGILEPSRSKLKLHALEDLGMAYVEMGRYEDAELILKKALTINDADASNSISSCAIQLGGIYLYWGRLEDAFAFYDFSISFDRNRDSSWFLPKTNEVLNIGEEIDERWNPLLEIFEVLHERYNPSEARRFCRDLMVRKYSWAIPTEEILTAICRHGSIVEIGAGTGYWSALLKLRGADVIAYDCSPSEAGQNSYTLKRKSWTKILPGNESAVASHGDRALMLCWPPDKDEMAYRALTSYEGDILIFIGEEPPGCTADEHFHKLVRDEWRLVEQMDLPRWHLIKDSAFFYSRK